MMGDELNRRQRKYRAHWHAYAMIKRLRWVTLVLGPFPIVWDNILAPALAQFGLPDIVTMEDLAQAIVFRTGWITQETFDTYWPHINNVCTLLFVVFLFWTIQKKRAAKEAAREVVALEQRMSVGGLGGVQ